MIGLKLQRLGTIMEPEPGNLHEVEGVLNPGAARGLTANCISSLGWLRREIIRGSGLRACASTTPATRRA